MQDVEIVIADSLHRMSIRLPVSFCNGEWITVGNSLLSDVKCGFIPAVWNMQISLWNQFLMVKIRTQIYFGIFELNTGPLKDDGITVALSDFCTQAAEKKLSEHFIFYNSIYRTHRYDEVKSHFVQQFDKPIIDSFSISELLKLSVGFIGGNLHFFELNPASEVVVASLWAMALVCDLKGNGPLEGLLSATENTEISMFPPGQCWVESSGKWMEVQFPFSSWSRLQQWLLLQSCRAGAELFSNRGFSDFSLACGSRVHVAFAPVTRGSACVTIRVHRTKRWSIQELASHEMLSRSEWMALDRAIKSRNNILLVGPTSSGKTTLLGALIDHCSAGERILVLEDVAELNVSHPHVVYLQCKSLNSKSGLNVTLDDLVRESLRMRPDRVVVGECRGKEAFALLQALHTGHQGSLCTLHGNSVLDAIDRFQALVLQAQPQLSPELVKRMIFSSIDLVVFLSRDGEGKRRISEMRFLGRESLVAS